MKKFCILIVAICVSILIFSSCSDPIVLTDDIAYYDSAATRGTMIFLDEIPSTAEIVSFSYYNYWNEEKDVYLELKFSSADTMEAYLNELKEYSFQFAEQCNSNRDDWFISEENPYNSSYTDMFCEFYAMISENKEYTGYIIETDSNENQRVTVECCYAIISYSYDDLTVIQTHAVNDFVSDIHNYIPCYIRRFDVDTSHNHERLIYM